MHTIHVAPDSKSLPIAHSWQGTGRLASPLKQSLWAHKSQSDHWVLESVETFAIATGHPGQNYICVLNYKGDKQHSGNEWNSKVVKSLHGHVPRPTSDTSVWAQPCYGRFLPCAVTKNCIKRLLTAHCRVRTSASITLLPQEERRRLWGEKQQRRVPSQLTKGKRARPRNAIRGMRTPAPHGSEAMTKLISGGDQDTWSPTIRWGGSKPGNFPRGSGASRIT